MTSTAWLIVLPSRMKADGPAGRIDLEKAGATDWCWLCGGLAIVRTGMSRSKLYHAVKRQLGADLPLLVVPLADAPKFKGMAPGALTWVREHM